MRKLLTLLFTLVITVGLFAATPEKMTYQAVVRNSDGDLITDKAVGLQISIIKDAQSGDAVYVETHLPTTNTNGLLTISIGEGTIQKGSFSAIDWAAGPYYLKSEIDPNGSSNYTISGTDPIWSVPYALHAKTAERITGPIDYTETDSVFGRSEAAKISAADIQNLAQLSGKNTGDQDLSALSTYAALRDSLEGVRGDMPKAISDLLLEADAQCISNVANPKNAQDVATKAYVDSLYTRVMYLFDLRNQLEDGDNIYRNMNIRYYGLENLLQQGVSYSDLIAVGVTIDDFSVYGISVDDLLEAGVSYSELLDATLYIDNLYDYGISIIDLLDSGISLQQLLSVTSVCELISEGMSFPELVELGLSAADFLADNVKRSKKCSLAYLLYAGVDLADLIAIGATYDDLDANMMVTQMLDIGMSISEIIDLGAPLDAFIDEGIEYDSIKAAGVSLQQLVQAGLPYKVFEKEGISIDSLLSEGVTLEQLILSGVNYESFLNAGYTLLWLYENGVGFEYFEQLELEIATLIESGIPLIDFINYGMQLEEIMESGISLYDIVQGGVAEDDLIGLYYQGGVIAYILQAGDAGYEPDSVHGLIATQVSDDRLRSASVVEPVEGLTEDEDPVDPIDEDPVGDGPDYTYLSVDSYVSWQYGESNSFVSTSAALGAGAANTAAIIAAIDDYGIAATLCHLYGDLSGYTDWYLPSKEELNQLYMNRVKIGGFDYFAPYWSSSEVDADMVWMQYFISGKQAVVSKQSECRLRPVRSF